jgi:Zn-dependent protease
MTTYGLWLLSHPGYDLLNPFRVPHESVYDPRTGLAGYFGLPAVPWLPLLDWQAETAIAMLGLAFLAYRSALGTGLAAPSLIACAIGLLSMLVSWHSDGYEVVRHMVEAQVLATLGVLGLAVAAVAEASKSQSRPRGI